MRGWIAGLFIALAGVATANAQAPAPAAPTGLAVYGVPQRLVKLPDGRRIHLYCLGQGSPTVILTAGQGGWAISWSKVQAEIARRSRVCAWDRAGFGHSDASPLPQTLANMTADLEGALTAARIKGPYVLVGHSAGAFETLQFADRHREAVVGMVLVDPSVPDQRARFAALAPDVAKTSAALTADSVRRQNACADQLAAGTLKPEQAEWSTCFRYFPDFSAKAVARLKQADTDPARVRTRVSSIEHFAENAEAVADPKRNYGDLPLIVLTQGSSPAPPGASPEQAAALSSGWVAWHDEYAKLSTRGLNLIVRGAGHTIQADRPQAVVAAVDAVLDAARR